MKLFFKVIALVLVSIITLFLCLIWYNAYDVIGLELYNNEPILDIIPYYDNIYVISKEGYCYVSGGYHNSSTRKYRNSESYHNDKLNIASSVRVGDEKFAKIIPYDNLGVLLINENGELFDFDDFNIRKIYDDVLYAVKAPYMQGEKIFGEDCGELYYIIDTHNTLFALNGNGKSKELFTDVCAVDYYSNTILVLSNNGDLNQYSISDKGEILLKERLFENVCQFDIEDTSLRFDGEKLIFDDDVARDTPLINVLTTNGEIYAKGAYNLLCCTRSISAFPEPKIIHEWTLIAEKVESFSMAPMGTAIKYLNDTAAYYGFDTDNSSDSKFEFGYLQLDITDVVGVYASDVQVLIKTEQAFHIWGYSLEFDVENENNNLFTGTPIIISP